jgi:MFS family permease
MVSSIIVATPVIGIDFPADVALLNWVTATFFIFAAVLLIPFGRVAGIQGGEKGIFRRDGSVYRCRRRFGPCPGYPYPYRRKGSCRCGGRHGFGTSLALVSLVFPDEERGRAIGINIAAMFTGFALGLLAGGAIAGGISRGEGR